MQNQNKAGQILSRARREMGLMMKDAAFQADIPTEYLFEAELGRIELDDDTLYRLGCIYFDSILAQKYKIARKKI